MARFGWKLPKRRTANPGEGPGKRPDSPSVSGRPGCRRAVLTGLHVVLVGLVVAALAYLNHAWGLDRLVNSSWGVLRAGWLPLLFLLAYLLCRLSWYAVRQLGPDRLTGEFPDLDDAWTAARRRLVDNGIDLGTTPLFLVLGQPEGGLELLFAASHWPFQVRYVAPGEPPALHVYGNREAVFVACGSGSVLAATAQSQAEARRAESPEATAVCLSADRLETMPEGEQGTAATAPDPEEAAHNSTTAPADPDGSPAAAVSGPLAVPRASLLGDEPCDSPLASGNSWPIRDSELCERLAARLQSLCRTIAAERRPLVPVNGLLVLLPLFGTDDARSAKAVADACLADLRVARASLEVECPSMAMLCDFQQVSGFEELVVASPDSPTQQWVLGRTFPLVPDIEDSRWPTMIDRGLRWLSDSLWPSAVYPIMEPGAADWHEGDPAMDANRRRFRLLEEGWRRLRMAPELVVRGFRTSSPARPLFGGFAVAATGVDGVRQQAFVAGVLRWLVEVQDHVSWSEEAVRDDLACRRWSLFGTLGLAGLLVVLVALSVRLLW